MLIAAAIGNTTLRWIAWDSAQPVARGAVPVAELARAGALDPLFAVARNQVVVAASVNPPVADALAAALGGVEAGLRLVGREVKLPLRIALPDPKKIGTDRLCGALAAHALGGGAAIVVDAGTAITVSAVSAAGEFRGGAIAPGPALAARALREGTAQLPEAPVTPPARVLGRTTGEALAAGLAFGLGGAVRALVEGARAELGEPARVFGTGGGLIRLSGINDLFDRFEPDLVLIGVRIAAEHVG